MNIVEPWIAIRGLERAIDFQRWARLTSWAHMEPPLTFRGLSWKRLSDQGNHAIMLKN